MNDEYLFCNYKKCKMPITKYTWVTRCSHVFCEKHGNSFFINNTSKIKCPVCNESIVRETDIIKTNLCPHDMMLCCVRPDKALDYVTSATKLWSYQMRQKSKVNIQALSEKYEKIASDAMSRLKTENSEMKKFIKEVECKLQSVNKELAWTKRKLWKYKLAYNNICLRNQKSPIESDRNCSFFQKFSTDSCNEEFEVPLVPSPNDKKYGWPLYKNILQYGDISNFDHIKSPKFD